MSLTSLTFAGGMVLGLASSLHCAGMCGGIASVLSMSVEPESDAPAARARGLLTLQAGRVFAYTLMGAAVGGIGTALIGHIDHPALYLLLRLVAALSLGWIGLSLTGLAPGIAVADRLFLAVADRIRAGAAALRLEGPPGAVAMGLAWGFVPCGMVYGTLVFAAMTGTPWRAASVMAGFGLGTIPAVTLAAFGMTSLRRLAHNTRLQVGVGLAIMALGAASFAVPQATIAALCGVS
ncbi:MAG: sulfite exporter TauE/SafE family protein [Sphingomonadales bacterium]|nr:sulfite exporter TauE/SafE family protein [Sphingomonadales bacterium]MDE2567785.1 sulfite exporter TauE/SafE family protein [Sphingomonadales bacterium]